MKKILYAFLVIINYYYSALATENKTFLQNNNFQERDKVYEEANLHLENGKIEEAISIYEKYLDNHPEDIDIITCLAGIYGLKGCFDKEEQLCLKALKIDPTNPKVYINLGNAQAQLKKRPEARKSFENAYECAKKIQSMYMIDAAYALSNYYLQGGTQSDNQNAILWADECIKLTPKPVIEGAKFPKEALAEFSQEIKHSEFLYESAVMNKAGALGNMGKIDEARKLLENYLVKHPESEDIKAMLSYMKDH